MGFENRIRSIQPDKGNNPEANSDERNKDTEKPQPTTSIKDVSENSNAKPVEATDTIITENYVQENMFGAELGKPEEKAVTESEKSAQENEAPTGNIEGIKANLTKTNNPEEYYQLTLDLIEEVDSLPENDPKRVAFDENRDSKLKAIENKMTSVDRDNANYLNSLPEAQRGQARERIISNLERIREALSNTEPEGNSPPNPEDAPKPPEKNNGNNQESQEKTEAKEKEVSSEQSKAELEKAVSSYKEITYLENTETIKNFNARGIANVTDQELNAAASSLSANLETSINKSSELKNLIENYTVPDVETKIGGLETNLKELQDLANSISDESAKAEIQNQIKEIEGQIKVLSEISALKNQIIMEITRINQEIEDLKSQLGFVDGEQKSQINTFENSINSQIIINKETLKIIIQ